MKIELGKTYKTRGGHKARIICVDRNSSAFPIVALIAHGFDEDTQDDVAVLTERGEFFTSHEDRRDLIEEWREPLTVWGVASACGSFYAYSSEDSAAAAARGAGDKFRVVKLVEVAE